MAEVTGGGITVQDLGEEEVRSRGGGQQALAPSQASVAGGCADEVVGQELGEFGLDAAEGVLNTGHGGGLLGWRCL